MGSSEWVIIALLFLSNAFWAWNTQKLINKLMSRNYFEFKDASLKSEEKPKTIIRHHDDTEDFGALSELTT